MDTYLMDGNVVDAVISGDVDVLLHITNCQGIMGSGIALEIKNKIPSAYKSYMYDYHSRRSDEMFGGSTISDISLPCVVNLNAQYHYGRSKRQLNYAKLGSSLCSAVRDIDDNIPHNRNKPLKIGIPYLMGCDRAGGNWDIVLNIVKDSLLTFKKHDNVELVIYKL